MLGWGIAEVAVMINTVAACRYPIFTGSTWLLICWKTRIVMTVSPGGRWVFTARKPQVDLIADAPRSRREKLVR